VPGAPIDGERANPVGASRTHPSDVVEAALARAIDAEVNDRGAGWEARVASLADELRARRLAREGVPILGAKAPKRSV
jgi:hypothetical protein